MTRDDVALPVLARSLADFIARGEDDPAAFDRLAKQMFAYQYRHNAPYRTFCDGRGVTPDTLAAWHDIPAAPAAAWKQWTLSCASEHACQPRQGGRVFHSSGTTGTETSRNHLDAVALDLYRLSLRAGYGRFVLPDNAVLPVFALMPPPAVAPHSSLSFMLGELIGDYGGRFFWQEHWQDDLDRALHGAAGPIVVFGTAFAWVHFFDATVGRAWRLPDNSRVVETGGFKGRSREIHRDDLYALFASRLGVPLFHCLSEYGMSELASQCYDSTLRDRVGGVDRATRKAAPPWLRTRMVNPLTGGDAVPGEPGLVVHYDLANLNSVVALQTEDWGQEADDGDGFQLLGRAPGAVLRGCSLAAETMSGRQP